MVTVIKRYKFHSGPANMHEILMKKLDSKSDRRGQYEKKLTENARSSSS